jgi:hypothetical protein
MTFEEQAESSALGALLLGQSPFILREHTSLDQSPLLETKQKSVINACDPDSWGRT